MWRYEETVRQAHLHCFEIFQVKLHKIIGRVTRGKESIRRTEKLRRNIVNCRRRETRLLSAFSWKTPCNTKSHITVSSLHSFAIYFAPPLTDWEWSEWRRQRRRKNTSTAHFFHFWMSPTQSLCSKKRYCVLAEECSSERRKVDGSYSFKRLLLSQLTFFPTYLLRWGNKEKVCYAWRRDKEHSKSH